MYTDYTYAQRNDPPKDSLYFNDYQLYGFKKIDYKPRYLTNAIFIDPGDVYSDESRNKSLVRIGQLRTFKYPDLRFTEDPADSTGRNLIANFYLSPLPKFNASVNFDISRSNIQKFGIAGGGSLLMRNVLGGMETLQLSGRGSIGASATPDDASAFLTLQNWVLTSILAFRASFSHCKRAILSLQKWHLPPVLQPVLAYSRI